MLGAVQALPARRGPPRRRACAGGTSLAKKDIEGVTTLLDRRRDEDVRRAAHAGDLPAERRRRPAARASASTTPSAIFADHVRERYGAEPGFITMNLPRAARRARRSRASRTRSSARTSTRSASGCRGGRRGLRARRCASAGSAPIAMSVFASGAIPPREAIEWVCAQPNIESIVFGASSRAQHPAAPASSWRAIGTWRPCSHDHAPRRLHRRAPEAAAPPAPATRRRRGPVPLGDVRHAAEPLAARRRGRSTSCTSSAGATRSTCCATCRWRTASCATHDIDTIVSTGSVDGAAVLRARPRPRAGLPLHRERRAQRRAVEDRGA